MEPDNSPRVVQYSGTDPTQTHSNYMSLKLDGNPFVRITSLYLDTYVHLRVTKSIHLPPNAPFLRGSHRSNAPTSQGRVSVKSNNAVNQGAKEACLKGVHIRNQKS